MLTTSIIGEGYPVVLLPGFALDSSVMMTACEPAFADTRSDTGERWQRIYLDLPGTGGSPTGEPTSEAVLSAIQGTVVELLGDTPYLLAGHSYGAYLAAGLTRRNPTQVAGLFLVCPGQRIMPADRDLSGVLPSVPEPGWLDGVPEDLHEHVSHAVGQQTREAADRVAAALGRRGPIDEEYLDALRPAGYRLQDEPDPADPTAFSFPGPVTLLTGRRDRIAGYRDSLSALTQYPHGSFVALADAGHYLPFEQPEAFAMTLLTWLATAQPTLAR
jgi:pimeloyl-ACP methyl ester carboxylesterase